MAWPVSSDLLCHMFGLIDASPEVREAEHDDSDVRMRRLADDNTALTALVSAATDASQVLALVTDDEERAAWMATYALAVVNLLEALGKVRVTA